MKHLDEIVPRRKHEAAKNVLMSTEEITKRSDHTVSKFHLACRDPTREEVSRMLGMALEEAVKVAMRNHVYTFNGEVRRQSEGCAIGNKLTGAMAKVYMSRWTRQLRCNLAQATEDIDDFELYVLKYYVDDNNLVMEAIPPGYSLIEGRLRLMEDRVENDRAIPADERTAKVVKQLANDICRFIQMEVDYPSRHQSGWMPILDFQVQIAEDKSVDFKFYQKPMAPPTTILNRSAMPARVKWNNNVQQEIRRLRNTRPRLHAETRDQLMEEWAEVVMVSGYTKNHRKEAIQCAVVGYERMVERDAKGQTPLYRPRLWNKEEKRKKKLMKNVAW